MRIVLRSVNFQSLQEYSSLEYTMQFLHIHSRFQIITIVDDYQKADPWSKLHDPVIIAWLLLLLISLIEVPRLWNRSKAEWHAVQPLLSTFTIAPFCRRPLPSAQLIE